MKRLLFLFFGLVCFGLSLSLYGQEAENIEDNGFYSAEEIREIRLFFKDEEGNALENWQELMDSLRLYGNGRLMGNINIDGQEYKNVGVSITDHRGFSIGEQRNPLTIRLNYIDKSQNHDGHTVLKLSTALRDPSMIREVLGYEIARNYMPAPQANFARLFVNDDYRGLYVNLEAIDDDFLETHFSSSDNTFVKCRPAETDNQEPDCKKNVFGALEYDEGGLDCYKANFILKSDGGWDRLVELTRVLTESPADAKGILDIDNTLWMLAFNNVTVNLSSYTGRYSQNYYLYEDEFGRFNPILWDLNLAFGSYKNTGMGSDLDLKGLQMMDPLLHLDNPNKPLISALLQDNFYKKVYLHHVRSILNDYFTNGKYEERAAELHQKIQAAYFNDPYKYYEPEEFKNSLNKTIGQRSRIPGITELMTRRAKFLSKHPEITILPPDIQSVEVKSREKYAKERINTFKITAEVDKFPRRVFLFYRTDPGEDFRMVQMLDDGVHNDEANRDNIFGAEIDPKGDFNSVEFYIMAENARAINFYPADYMNAPIKSTLQELN